MMGIANPIVATARQGVAGAITAVRGPLTLMQVGDSKLPSFTDGNQMGFGTGGAGLLNTVSYGFLQSWPWVACMLSGGMVRPVQGPASPGWTTVNVDAVWATYAAQKPDIVVFEIGFNDIFGSTDVTVAATVAYLKSWWLAKTEQVKAWGGRAIWCTGCPVPASWGSYSVAKQTAQIGWMDWIRDNARASGAILFDEAAYVVDPASANGETFAAYSPDKVHPANQWRRLIGTKLWTEILSKLVTTADALPRSQKVTGRLFTDPLMLGNPTAAGGGASGNVPASLGTFNQSAAVTYSIVAAGDGIGNWAQCSVNTAAIGTAGPGFGIAIPTTGLAAGSTVRVAFELQVTAASSLYGIKAALQIGGTFNGTANTNYAVGAGICETAVTSQNSADPGTYTGQYWFDLTVPAGYSALQGTMYLFILGMCAGSVAGTNTWAIRRLDVHALS